jgi:hypothetical protein
MKILYRAVDGGLTSVGTREFEGTAATSELQGDGFALAMSGANLSRFKNGGPLLFNHDTAHQVGRVTSIRTTATALVFRATFPSAGISKHADETCGLVKEGILSGISLGFGVDEGEPINPQRPVTALSQRLGPLTKFRWCRCLSTSTRR